MNFMFPDDDERYRGEADYGLDLMMGSYGRTGAVAWPPGVMGWAASKILLVVDDEERIRDMFKRFFTAKGFTVLTASTAVEAREILLRRNVGIICLDINMPEVGGGTLLHVVRTFHPEVKVVVTSVYPVEEQRRRASEADAYFDKSDGKDVLWRTVSAIV
ncbi:MAG: response regulator [Candidatus Omnitrophica bacterium]|nr:response regulator [Candidatus Omnitrophota bacterium]